MTGSGLSFLGERLMVQWGVSLRWATGTKATCWLIKLKRELKLAVVSGKKVYASLIGT